MGRKFWKMSGSGNDFVVFDVRGVGAGREPLERPEAIEGLCARGTGVGADGVVFVAESSLPGASLAMRYYNSDGSRGALCGNATLCVTRLSPELGIRSASGLVLETDSGLVSARNGEWGPEIDLPPVTETEAAATLATVPGETSIGYAVVGVPHLVVRCSDVATIPVAARGGELRNAGYGAGGSNVNFVSARDGVWSIRTFERGVEAETLACGSGAVATAILLAMWRESGESTFLRTRSGRPLGVRLRRDGSSWIPTLAGEGRIVFTGEIAELSI
ncbi:MAG: diaminopimelate epimerase [Candidatus Elarobacter sp.]